MPIALTDFGRALAAAALLGTCCLAAEATRIEVRETAGIQRFGYPLAAEFHASAATQPENFRLLDGGRELAAQFTRLAGPRARRTLSGQSTSASTYRPARPAR